MMLSGTGAISDGHNRAAKAGGLRVGGRGVRVCAGDARCAGCKGGGWGGGGGGEGE